MRVIDCDLAPNKPQIIYVGGGAQASVGEDSIVQGGRGVNVTGEGSKISLSGVAIANSRGTGIFVEKGATASMDGGCVNNNGQDGVYAGNHANGRGDATISLKGSTGPDCLKIFTRKTRISLSRSLERDLAACVLLAVGLQQRRELRHLRRALLLVGQIHVLVVVEGGLGQTSVAGVVVPDSLEESTAERLIA